MEKIHIKSNPYPEERLSVSNSSFESVSNSSFENGRAQEINKSDQTETENPARSCGFLKAIFDFLYMIISSIPPFSIFIKLKKENAELKENLNESNAKNKQIEERIETLENTEEITALREQVCKAESQLKIILLERENLQKENAELKKDQIEAFENKEEIIKALQEKNRVLNLDLIESRKFGSNCVEHIRSLKGRIVYLNFEISTLGGSIYKQAELDEDIGFSLC